MPFIISIFVASPSDVRPERQIVAEVVGELGRAPHVRRFAVLSALLYESEVPLGRGPPRAGKLTDHRFISAMPAQRRIVDPGLILTELSSR
jgi:hypothetical protein